MHYAIIGNSVVSMEVGFPYLVKKPVEQDRAWEFVIGLSWVWLANAVHFGLSWTILNSPGVHPIAGWVAIWFPVLQFVYVIPMVVRARRQNGRWRMWGVIVAGSVTFASSVLLWLQILRAVGRGLR